MAKQIKAATWERDFPHTDNGRCVFCKMIITKRTFDVGHVYPKFLGGVFSVSNLVPMCRTCNTSMGAKDLREYIRQWWGEHSEEYKNIMDRFGGSISDANILFGSSPVNARAYATIRRAWGNNPGTEIRQAMHDLTERPIESLFDSHCNVIKLFSLPQRIQLMINTIISFPTIVSTPKSIEEAKQDVTTFCGCEPQSLLKGNPFNENIDYWQITPYRVCLQLVLKLPVNVPHLVAVIAKYKPGLQARKAVYNARISSNVVISPYIRRFILDHPSDPMIVNDWQRSCVRNLPPDVPNDDKIVRKFLISICSDKKVSSALKASKQYGVMYKDIGSMMFNDPTVNPYWFFRHTSIREKWINRRRTTCVVV